MVAAKAKRCHCEINGDGRGLGSSMQLWPPMCYSHSSIAEVTHTFKCAAVAEGVLEAGGSLGNTVC